MLHPPMANWNVHVLIHTDFDHSIFKFGNLVSCGIGLKIFPTNKICGLFFMICHIH